jgi:hypothetical protein
MNPLEIKELIISSLSSDADTADVPDKLEQEGVTYDFGEGFSAAVLNRIFPVAIKMKREIEFLQNMNFAFRSIAVSGIAAIILLLISIYLMEGKVSFDSFLGLKDNYDESIICLLTGN